MFDRIFVDCAILNDPVVSQKRIDKILDEANVSVHKVMGECVFVFLRLRNGTNLTEYVFHGDPALGEYDDEKAEQLCFKRLRARVHEMENYAARERRARKRDAY